MNKDEAKEALKFSLNKRVNILYKRYRNIEYTFNGKIKKERLCYEWDSIGIVRKVRKGSILLSLNDDEKLISLGYRNIKKVKIII